MGLETKLNKQQSLLTKQTVTFDLTFETCLRLTYVTQSSKTFSDFEFI